MFGGTPVKVTLTGEVIQRSGHRDPSQPPKRRLGVSSSVHEMASLDDDEIERLHVWVNDSFRFPNIQKIQSIMLKNGPLVFKTASVLMIGGTPDAITLWKLVLQTSMVVNGQFIEDRKWTCEDGEVDALVEHLSTDIAEAGTHDLIKSTGEAATLLRFLR